MEEHFFSFAILNDNSAQTYKTLLGANYALAFETTMSVLSRKINNTLCSLLLNFFEALFAL